MNKFLTLAASAAIITFGANAAIAGDHDHHGDMNKGGDHAEKMMMDKAAALDIVDTAASNPDFSTLVAAVKAADLVDALKGDGPLTVFAPTNEAFAALPEGTLDDLLKPENKSKLQDILKYHVVPGKIMASDIASGESEVPTLQGATAQVINADGGVTIDGANIVTTDLETSNGVIHVIDAVILPE